MMKTESIFALGFACLLFTAAVIYMVWGIVELYLRKGRQGYAQTEGTVCGLVQQTSLQNYETKGEVPKVSYHYWGRTTASGSNKLYGLLRVFFGHNWYPCIQFSADGAEQQWVLPGGAGQKVWRVGQKVQERYNKEEPTKFVVMEDPSPIHSAAGCFIFAMILFVAGMILLHTWHVI